MSELASTYAGFQTDAYRVDLAVLSGPLDLLLYHIKQEEVDIYEIPIERLTNQSLRYVEMMTTLDLEVAGEFILMAATLIRIKTRLLLPQDETDSEEPDPREELIMALVEYRKYKEAGEELRQRAIIEERFYVPPSPVEQIKGRVDLEPVTSLYDLLVAFREVMTTKPKVTEHRVNPEEVSIEERMRVILHMLQEREFATFTELFADLPRRMVMVVTFMALLELARNRRVQLLQAVPFSEVRVMRGERSDLDPDQIDFVSPVTSDEEGETA